MADIKRYSVGIAVEDEEGAYILHSDHLAAIKAAVAETARRCVEAIQKYLDYHNAACAHYTPKDHPAFSYHLTRVAISSDIKQAIKAEFPEAFK